MTYNSSQAAFAYRKAATVLPPEMAIVRLYDCVIVLIQRTIDALEAKRRDEGFAHINKAAAILRGLSHVLDHKKGGVLADRLSNMYAKNIVVLYSALGKADASSRYRKLSAGLVEMRDAWAAIAGLPTRAQMLKPRSQP